MVEIRKNVEKEVNQMLKDILSIELEDMNIVADDTTLQLAEELAGGCGALFGCGGNCKTKM